MPRTHIRRARKMRPLELPERTDRDGFELGHRMGVVVARLSDRQRRERERQKRRLQERADERIAGIWKAMGWDPAAAPDGPHPRVPAGKRPPGGGAPLGDRPPADGESDAEGTKE